MNLNQRSGAFVQLGMRIHEALEGHETGKSLFVRDELFDQVLRSNPWFIPENTWLALRGIVQMLEPAAVKSWLENYPWLNDNLSGKRPLTAVIMAGNIPAVGFHDLFCTLLAGHNVLIRLSSKDRVLPRMICDWLIAIEPLFTERIQFSEGPIGPVNAVIATGSNNTGRYFEHYFGKTSHIFRKNRFSLAILDGQEQADTLRMLASDVFSYFGMGCRNVSRLLLPEDYPVEQLISAFSCMNQLTMHSKFYNNYEYNKALALINGETFSDGHFFILKPVPGNAPPPLAALYYNYYRDRNDLNEQLRELSPDLQCVVHDGRIDLPGIAPGQTQFPGPDVYADGVDTLEFLKSISLQENNAQ